MTLRVAALDAEDSPLGRAAAWPPALTATLRLMLASRQPMLLLWGEQTIQIYNDGCAEVLGPDQLGQPARQQIGPLWQLLLPQAQSLFAGAPAAPTSGAVAVMRAGVPAWWRSDCSPITDGHGVQGVLAIFHDVTNDHQLHQTLSAELAHARALAERAGATSDSLRRLYEAILDSTPDLVYVFDLHYRFIYANQVLLQMWGKSYEEAIGKNCLELGYEPWHAAMHEREIDQVRATRLPIRGEVPFDGAFGRRIYDYIFVPVLGPDGTVEAVAGTTRDVTDRKMAELALQAESVRKDEFLAMLAHELRNPLAPIAAAASLLKHRPLDDTRLSHISAVMTRQVRHMTGLVDDLLDVSRVTRGKITLSLGQVDLRSVITEAVEQTTPLIDSRRHTLAAALPGQAMTVTGDHKRLVQVVSNILANAAKYTPDGGQIGIRVAADGPGYTLAVHDSGIGMAPELVEHAFDLFVQGQRSADRAQGGLGIGLALVQRLVQLHGGSVAASSAGPGLGSTFAVTLPAA